jgi:CDGSH-type Zn-finger protein
LIIKCNSCGTEYVLIHFKLPFKDKGETLYCKCGQSVFSYDKGTDSYSIEEVSIYRERMRRIEEEKKSYPICDCGKRMVPRTGPYGDFFGCADYPKGCNKTIKR